MNQSQIRTSSYAVAGACAFALLILLGWLALREPMAPADGRLAKVGTSPLRARRITPSLDAKDDGQTEMPTNRVAVSGTTNSNAAVLYQQAFALFDSLTKEQKELIKDWRTNVDQSVTAELCERIRPIADLMHQAAAVTNCNWGLDEPITFESKLPHLAQSRSIARAAIWSAAHCRTDDSMGAVDDLVATARLGQNLSPAMILTHLVDLAIQGLAIDFIAERADTLAGTGDTRLVQLFDDTHYNESLSRGIGVEADMLDREADRWAAMPPEELAHELKQLNEDNPAFQSVEPAQAVAGMRQAAELEREFADALLLSEAEYRDALARVQAAGKPNPFAEVFLSNEGLVDKTQAMTVRSAMVAAGLTVMQSGPQALQSRLDPTTGKPFAYTQTTVGFELQSDYQANGQPIKLQFK